MKKETKSLGYENHAICAECGGKCCKRMPGIVLPDDLKKPLKESVMELLFTGKYAVDWWEGDPRDDEDEYSYVYYIRPKVKGHEKKLLHPSWGGECIFLTDTGCELPFEQRPAECRMLEPVRSGECIYHGVTKQEFALIWLEYQDIIEDVIKIIK